MNPYRHILDHYGPASQVDKTLEELDELHRALRIHGLHREWFPEKRVPDRVREQVIDELADVMVMCEQMCELFGRQAVNERIHYKLSRQLRRIEKGL